LSIRLALALVVVAGAGGCGGADPGPKVFPVTGTVTSQQKPVTGGSILFMSDKGLAATAELDAAGHYKVSTQYGSGLPAGAYKVSISPPPPPLNSLPEKEDSHPEIPKKYRDLGTSGLTAVVKEGSNDFPFDLEAAK
jgi:hypothetical protein